jgi:hypothetical protein
LEFDKPFERFRNGNININCDELQQIKAMTFSSSYLEAA